MRLLILTASLLLTIPLQAQAGWIFDADKDALSTPAIDHSGPVRPELVVVCNNMTRLTYVRWPTDFDVARKRLPNHVSVDYHLIGENNDDTRTSALFGEIWTVARPRTHVTHIITHDLLLPERLTRSATMLVTSRAKNDLPELSANFSLIGLQAAVDANYLPCREGDKFLLKMLHELEAEAAATPSDIPSLPERAPPPPLPNFDP